MPIVEIFDHTTEQPESEEVKQLKCTLEQMKSQFAILFEKNLSISLPKSTGQLTDTILIQLGVAFSELKKKIEGVDTAIHKLLDRTSMTNNELYPSDQREILPDYLPVVLDELTLKLNTLRSYVLEIEATARDFMKRSKLLYPDTNDLKELENLQASAFDELNNTLGAFLTVATDCPFEIKEPDADYLRVALVKFSSQLTKDLLGAVSIDSIEASAIEMKRGDLSLLIENKFSPKPEAKAEKKLSKLDEFGNAVQAKLASLKLPNLPLFSLTAKKELSSKDKIKLNLPYLYQTITQIQEFPLTAINRYCKLLVEEAIVEQGVKLQHEDLRATTQSLLIQLDNLLSLFDGQAQTGGIISLKQILLSSNEGLNYKIEKKPIKKESLALKVWVNLSIEEQNRILLLKSDSEQSAADVLKHCHKSTLLAIQSLSTCYKEKKYSLAHSFLMALTDAETTNKLLPISAHNELLKKLKHSYSLLFENQTICDHTVRLMSPNHAGLTSLEQCASKAILQLKENFKKTKKELTKLRETKKQKRNEYYIKLNQSLSLSQANPFHSDYIFECGEIRAHFSQLDSIISASSSSFDEVSTSTELMSWCNQFDRYFEKTTLDIINHKRTVKKAQEIERRLVKPAYITSLKIIEDIRQEYERLYAKYSILEKNQIYRESLQNSLYNPFLVKEVTARQKRLLDKIDPRLAKLLIISQHIQVINNAYINVNLNLKDKGYLRLLLDLIQNDFHNDKMEQLSENKRLQIIHFLRINLVKPIHMAIKRLTDWLSSTGQNTRTPGFFRTPFPCKTERKLYEVCDSTLTELHQEIVRQSNLRTKVFDVEGEALESFSLGL
ncbi:MAG: hypothetical protein H0U75_00220 [Legionella sp.]|nr:hypothetical protein [Legionella sp.]